MIEAFILIAMLAMAKKSPKRRRRMGRYLRGKIEEDNDLGALAAKDVTIFSTELVTENTWLSSIRSTWSLKDLAVVTDDGPVIVGVAHTDYSAAEIEAFLESTGTWDVGNLITQELAKRKIRIVGTFELGLAAGETQHTATLNDGRPIHTKCGWMLNTGQGLTVWIYNAGASALTAGSALHNYGHANLWPR